MIKYHIIYMATDTAPSPNFSGIDFNPNFFSTSTSLTLAEADTLYLNKSVADTANVLETFTVGISANALQATTGSIDSLSVLGVLTSNYVDSIGTTLSLGYSNATLITSTLPLYVNSYYFTGTAPTLAKTSMNYFVNYSAVSASYTTTGSRYLYSPASNTSTGNSHYFQAGIYEAIIHVYVVQTGGPTFSGCNFTISAYSGTSTGTLSTSAQYGTPNVSSTSFSTANVGGINLNFLGAVFSHTGCFTLSSSAFINLGLFVSSLTAIINGTVSFSVYGVVKRIA
jgi:hypothetical protein